MPHDDARAYQLAVELVLASRDEGNDPDEVTRLDAIQIIGHVCRALSEEAALSGAQIDDALYANHKVLEGLPPPAGTKGTAPRW